MTREELEMRTLVRESDVIDRADGSELAKAFNYLWEKYVEQEPKTGHWIPIQEIIGVDKEGNEISTTVGYKCSKCLIVHPRISIFCPNCGAKMVEPQESEDKE